MKKTKCYSVRLECLVSISEKAYRATAFDGSTAILPKSQVFGQDFDVQKSEAYWISAWILEQKDLQYSMKKEAWFGEDGNQLPTYKVIKHTPKSKAPVENNHIEELAQ